MELGQQLHSLKYFRCNLGSHAVKKEDVENLRNTTKDELETTCSRCETPLLLKKDLAKHQFSIIET